ncbi:MAG: hypothetical protein QOE77_3158 [Blastocatellia bacterium]|jgi:CheY-like chemotaxis protein|nr:hypothetical protein [Blastocatellia bacterium]
MKGRMDFLMKLLFIDDEPQNIEPVVRALTEAGENCEVSDFGETEKRIDDFRPDIVILDLFEGPTAEAKATGLEEYDVVWNQRFCPLIVYSALPEAATGRHPPHPFVKSAKKGKDLTPLTAAIQELQPNVEALREVEKHVRKQLASALRDVAPFAFEAFDAADARNQAIVRSGRRRLAALMDAELKPGEKLAPWEHYIYPPVGEDILLGDILVRADSDRNEPDNFRVVLTPSCDLVTSSGRKAKVAEILVACCCSMKAALKLINAENTGVGRLRDRFPSILTQGYSDAMLPLPRLEGRIPCMSANLKNLELLSFKEKVIGTGEAKYIRIGSMDSPFRELVSWAYLQVAGRPGLPDRDFDKWTEEILTECQKV